VFFGLFGEKVDRNFKKGQRIYLAPHIRVYCPSWLSSEPCSLDVEGIREAVVVRLVGNNVEIEGENLQYTKVSVNRCYLTEEQALQASADIVEKIYGALAKENIV